ncbi:hypothetical protein D8B46_03045 [Candidatus Gracilibacteria bacterium]|nr:MAG: hypothetical protein D8B46_03045 [Candidatus Gracilibacteria bacterium]
MRTIIKKFTSTLTLSALSIGFIPINLETANAESNIVFPLKTVAKLECRFNDFDTLGNDCLEDLPILKTSDYKKYATENDGYNKFTRRYTVLWGASYKYGWDVGYGGHMGVDIVTAKGTPVYATADGEVINAKTGSAEGNFVSIKHNINGKTIVSNYLHLSEYLVSKGQTVRAGDLIGRVGSTGNSTGNHLHFQIDTLTTFSPTYYRKEFCPHSYYEITETGACFDELERITIDPLLFLETNGAILNSHENISKVPRTEINNNNSNNNISNNNSSSKGTTNTINQNSSIFDREVFIGSSHGDVREVQSIYKSLGYYKGEITGDYNDVLESVIKYQLEKNIIANRGDAGTGNFGPKTRAQTKKDYTAYVNAGGKKATTFIANESNNNKTEKDTKNDLYVENDSRVTVTTEKISRQNLMTREELEAKELRDFLKYYNIDLKFANTGENVSLGGTEIINLNITDSRGKYFKGNMPGAMTFETKGGNISVFPEKLYFFTDGKREIKISGLKEGTTTLNVKVGNVTIKTFNIRVYNGKKSITPDGADIVPQTSYLGNTQTGLAVVKEGNKKLINIQYEGSYKLKASDGNLVCLKSGKLSDIKNLYKPTCNNADFKHEVDFTYKDTVGGVIVFDYKTVTKNAKFEILNGAGRKLGEKNVVALEPKGVEKNYTYSGEVLASIQKGIATTGFKRGYFMQDGNISQAEGIAWVKNALKNMNSNNAEKQAEINSRLRELEIVEKGASSTKMLERAELLKIAYRYLVFNENKNISTNYKDLDEEQNMQANAIFGKDGSWKENTGQSYFKPKSLLTRGEASYLIMKTLENGVNNSNISLK